MRAALMMFQEFLGGIQFIYGAVDYPRGVKTKPTTKSKTIYYCRHCGYEQENDFEYCPKCLKMTMDLQFEN